MYVFLIASSRGALKKIGATVLFGPVKLRFTADKFSATAAPKSALWFWTLFVVGNLDTIVSVALTILSRYQTMESKSVDDKTGKNISKTVLDYLKGEDQFTSINSV